MFVFVIAISQVATSFLVALVLVPSRAATKMTDDYGDKLGTVNFPVSCNEPAQQLMERGVALLHTMTYSSARRVFEAACFYALEHMATAHPADKTYAKQRRAGAIAEKVRGQVPDHPGAHHYIIHAYDYPALAEKALPAARSYGKIAPGIPHALHMPTHIFTRLGFWQESITMNKRSAVAALKHPPTPWRSCPLV